MLFHIYKKGGDFTENGKLKVAVTAVRGLYPVKDATVTVFDGNESEIKSEKTDQSGQTGEIILPAPDKALSLDKDNKKVPYNSYKIKVSAEGFSDETLINVPVFSGVTSLQMVVLTPLSAENGKDTPTVIDEQENYGL